MNDLDALRFPVGRFALPNHARSPDELARTVDGRHHVAHVTKLRERAGW
jgi:hypothetical protein